MDSEGTSAAEEARAEAERTLRALWDLDTPPRRGPKPGITRQAIVEVAVRLADEVGLEGLSMRAVAEELDAGTMSLYRHVPSKHDLVALMVDHVSGPDDRPEDLPEDLPEERPGGAGRWRPRLEELARADWALYHRHPWLLQAPLGRVPPGPRTMARFDAGLQAALATGLSPRDALWVFSAVDQLVLGAARASVENLAVVRASGVTTSAWWEAQADLLARIVDPEAHPAVHAVVEGGAFEERGAEGDLDGFSAAFEWSLSLLLDGVGDLIAAGDAAADRPPA